MSANATHDRLLSLLAPVVAGQGLDLEDVTVSPAGRRRVLRVVVDRDGGVSLDHVAQVSQAVSAWLDAEDVMGSRPYVLEVTSPGVDRPLTEARHWRRAQSRLVRVTLRDGREVAGRVVGADESAVALDVGGQERWFPYAEIGPGRVQVEFGRGVTEQDAAEQDAGDSRARDVRQKLTDDGEQQKEADGPWTST
jgi:ribosome maturation factor RimP